MDQALTNKKFIEQIDDVIETLGGTPVDLELTEDREDDMVSNDVFIDKMDEVIEALGGTPSEIIVGDDKADDMVSDNIFQLKMEDVVKNMSGGGGGGSSDLSTAEVTITFESGFCPINAPFIDNNIASYFIGIPSGGTANVILYKGKAYGYCANGSISSVSGDIEIDPEYPEYGVYISGNGTIAITGDVS